MQPCWHLDFRLLGSRTVREYTAVFSQGCRDLPLQPQETNTVPEKLGDWWGVWVPERGLLQPEPLHMSQWSRTLSSTGNQRACGSPANSRGAHGEPNQVSGCANCKKRTLTWGCHVLAPLHAGQTSPAWPLCPTLSSVFFGILDKQGHSNLRSKDLIPVFDCPNGLNGPHGEEEMAFRVGLQRAESRTMEQPQPGGRVYFSIMKNFLIIRANWQWNRNASGIGRSKQKATGCARGIPAPEKAIVDHLQSWQLCMEVYDC